MHYPIRSNAMISDQTLSPINLHTKAQTVNITQSSDEIQIFNNESSDSSEDTNNFTKIHNSNSYQPYHFSNNEFQEIKLLKLLNELGTPLYAYKLIMEWAKDAHLSDYNFDSQHTSHKQIIKYLQKNCKSKCANQLQYQFNFIMTIFKQMLLFLMSSKC